MANGPLDPTPRLTASQKRAKRVLRKLVDDPEALASRSLQASSYALLPDDPYYGSKLQDLDKIVQTTPGSRPDSSLAMLATGLSPDTQVGAALTQAQAFSEQRLAAQEQAREDMIQANADAARAAQEASGAMGYVKAFSQTLFAAAEAPFQILTNLGRNAIDAANGGGDTAAWGDIFANTDLGVLSMGAADYYGSGTLNSDMLDMGDGFFMNDESPVANLRKHWDQQMLGTAGQNVSVQQIDEMQPDGTIKKVNKIVDDSPATLGQYAANNFFQLEVGSTPYSLVSGMLDLTSRAADPSMYVGVKNVNSAFVTGENLVRGKILGQSAEKLLPAADNVTATTDIGAMSSIAKRSSDKVVASRKAEEPRLAELTDVDRNLLAAGDELKAMRRELEEAGVPPEEAAAAVQGARIGAVSHDAAAYQRTRDLEGLGRTTGEVFDQEARLAEEDLAALRRQQAEGLQEAFTPSLDPGAKTVVAELREDGTFDLVHRATGARVAERRTLEEAESLAADMSRMPGYGEDVPLEDIRAWDSVQAEREFAGLNGAAEAPLKGATPDPAASGPEPATARLVDSASRGEAWQAPDGARDRVSLGQRDDVEGILWTPSQQTADELQALGSTPMQWVELDGATSAEAFSEAIQAAKGSHKFGASVHAYDTADYADMRLFLSKDGRNGFAIKQDGDIVSAFSSGDGVGAVDSIMPMAIQAGGRKADAFDTVLPDLYAKYGLKPVARTKWEDQYAPADWDKKVFEKFNNGEPDVVYFQFDPQQVGKAYTPGEGQLVATYDEAIAAQQAAITTLKASSKGASPKQLARLRVAIEQKQAQIDQLKASREQINAELELLSKRRAADEALMLEKSKWVAEKTGAKDPGDDVDTTLAFMQRVAGLEEGLNTVDVDKAVAFITGNTQRNTSRLFKAMALIEDPAVLYDMTKGKWGAALRRDVAGAKTENEVRAVLARHISRGDFNENVGRLRGIRIAAQVRHGKDTDALLSRYGQAFGEKGLKTVAWGKQIRGASVPWANARHIEDADGMTDLVYDTATYVLSMNKPKAKAGRGFEDAEQFRQTWIRKMDEAEDGMTRRRVWNQFNTEMVARAGREFDLSEDAMREFQKRMSLSHKQFNDTTEYLAEVRAASKGKPIVIDGKEWDWGDVAALESQLSNRVMPPNWDELRRAMKSAKEIEGLIADKSRWQDTITDITGSVFERYWRASVIAFRGAYVLRNMADIQLRMYLKGHPSMFTNPQGVFALAFSHVAAPDTWSGKKLAGLNKMIDKTLHSRIRADGRLDGTALMPEDPDMDLATYFAAPFMDLVANRNMSHVDVGLAQKPDQSAFKTLGYTTKEVGPDGRVDDGFWSGWEFEVGLLQNSPLARAVLDVESGNIPEHIQKIIDESGGALGPREALVNYYTYGQGRRVLDQARSGGAAIKELTGDPDLDGGAQLFRYMFGDDAISLRSRWDRLTLNRDPDLVRAAVQRKASNAEEWRAQRRQMQALIRKRAREDGHMIKDDSGKWIENPDNPLPVRKVQSEVVDRDDKARFSRFFDDSLTWFFTKSGRFETAAGYLPEFRYAKWDQAADLAKALSPEDARILVKNAREILGGAQVPNSWAASTLRRLERNAGQAKGSGAFRLADLDHVTDEYAGKQVQDMFYNALNRNQFAHSIRLLAPFAQPWANTLTEWTKLGLQNPNRVYAAGVVYAAGTGRGSNWLTNDPTNPNDSFFYRHPKTGQMMVGVPVMGPAIAALASGISAIKGGPGISSDMVEGAVPLQSMNLAIQNSLLPGAGPMMSIPATMLEDTGWYQSYLPDVVKTFLQPYTNVDPDSEATIASTLMPAWLQGILGGALGVPDFTGKAQRYLQPTMGYLMQSNPDGRYGGMDAYGNFVQTTDQQNALLRDAEQLSSALLFGRSVIQNVSPGSPIPEVLAKADDGRLLSTTVITQEYLESLSNTGDRGQALLQMADQYGPGILFTLLPTRGQQITPTDDAYQFLKANPDQAEKFGSTLALFAPGGGYSARFDRFQRRNGSNPTLSGEEMAREVNTLLRSAKEARLDQKLAAGELTQEDYDAQIQLLQESYKDVPTTNYDSGASDVLRADLARNAQSPEMQSAFPDVAASVNQYEEYRQYALANNATEGLSGAGNVEWRAWLRKKGAELVAANPKFRVAWVKAYGPEVEEDN